MEENGPASALPSFFSGHHTRNFAGFPNAREGNFEGFFLKIFQHTANKLCRTCVLSSYWAPKSMNWIFWDLFPPLSLVWHCLCLSLQEGEEEEAYMVQKWPGEGGMWCAQHPTPPKRGNNTCLPCLLACLSRVSMLILRQFALFSPLWYIRGAYALGESLPIFWIRWGGEKKVGGENGCNILQWR